MKQKLIGLCVSLAMAFCPAAFAATDIEIETAITDGVAWLAAQQNQDGSWPHSSYPVATTCFALTKLQERAYELGYSSPFAPTYDYSQNVIDGWEYIFDVSRTVVQAQLAVQDHTGGATGTMDNPDVNGNGYGIYFQDVNTGHNNYVNGVCLMALWASRTPNRPNDGGLDYNANQSPDTYLEIAQEAVEYLAWSQNDGGAGEGSWDYQPSDNDVTTTYDGSIGGYAALGLAMGELFGATVPQWVKVEMVHAFNNMQCLTPGPNYGGLSYRSSCAWVNQYKTGHLLWGLAFAGVAQSDQRFQDALAYTETHWRDVGGGTSATGWGYNTSPADYQAMFVLMKGFLATGIDLIDTDGDTQRDDDWFNQNPPLTPADDFASVLVAQQNANGSWSACNWGTSELCTTWALLTLERGVPEFEPEEVIPVPALSYWAYAVLTVLFIVFAYVGMRRRFN